MESSEKQSLAEMIPRVCRIAALLKSERLSLHRRRGGHAFPVFPEGIRDGLRRWMP